MKSKKRQTMMLSIIVFILVLGLGYAYLNSNLSINGTTNITSSSWNVYWNNVQVKTGSVTTVTTPATIQSGNTQVVFNVTLSQPGDYYEFTVNAVNNGSIDAMIDSLTQGVYASNGTTPRTLPEYLEYTVTYADDIPVEQNHILTHNTTETYKVRVYFKEDITASQLPSANDSIVFKFGAEYKQKDNSGVPKPIYKYYSGTTALTVGSSIPNGVTTYDNYQAAMNASGYQTFSRVAVSNNIITAVYIGYDSGNKVYYLRGGGATQTGNNWNYDSPYFADNKEVMLQAFGASNCTITSTDCFCDTGDGKAGYISAMGAGYFELNLYYYQCRVEVSGYTYCYHFI